MKILMTTDTVGGVWTYALELARSLRAARRRRSRWRRWARRCQSSRRGRPRVWTTSRCTESTYKLEWMHDPWTDVDRAGRWLLELEAEFRPDVVHLNGYSHATLAFRAPVVVVAHSCRLSWWRAVKGEAAPKQWQTYRDRVAARASTRRDVVVAPSRGDAPRLCEQLRPAAEIPGHPQRPP